MSSYLVFFERQFPSANSVLLKGPNPILVDSGFDTDFDATLSFLQENDCSPQALQMVVNTHWHCDHAGGNNALQTQYGVSIAAHENEAHIINVWDENACDKYWLGQPVLPFTVNAVLQDGDTLDTGTHHWQVIATPAHSQGHICLYCDGILVAGDTFHSDDIAWLQTPRYGTQSLIEQMMSALDTLAALKPEVSYSGHGAVTEKPMQRIDEARKRYEKWAKHPEKIGWHATKRIATYELMLQNGLTPAQFERYLLNAPWFQDYSRHTFRTSPEDFVQPLIDELFRSGAVSWRGDKLIPNAPYTVPKAEVD